MRTFEYLPTQILEVITCEVKPSDAIDVRAAYEALAHRRAATHAYVVLDVPPDRATALEPEILAVLEVARTHGVGLITIGDPADYATREELEKTQRSEPDPERLNEFVDTQLTQATKTRIVRALR